ncbi:MAG: SRPBCC family protein [Parahaliea sp.]
MNNTDNNKRNNKTFHICQVAFSCINASRLRRWYQRTFGFSKSGKAIFPPPGTSQIQGIPGAWEKCFWLVDQQDYFQLEFFQFTAPVPKPRSHPVLPSDIGYNLLGLVVDNFDNVIKTLRAQDIDVIIRETDSNSDRRAYLQDPEGNWLELFEQDPLDALDLVKATVSKPEIPTLARSIRISVEDLMTARDSFCTGMGMVEVSNHALHTPETETLWGLNNVISQHILLRADNFLVELIQYTHPSVRKRPQDYRLCDQGFMNIAFAYPSTKAFNRAFNHATRSGLQANHSSPVDIGVFRVMYVNDPQGISIELIHARKAFQGLTGFKPSHPYFINEIEIAAPLSAVWQKLTNHDQLGQWMMFNGRVITPGKERNGNGCIRCISAFSMDVQEEITHWQPLSHYRYRVLSGAPFRWYQGDIFIEDTGKNTSKVRWGVRFEDRLPLSGRLIATLLREIFRRDLKRLKWQLEASHPG